MMLEMILFMLLLEYSNYTNKKREAARFEELHQTRGAMVGELLHSKDFLRIGEKNTIRSFPKTNWRCIKAYERLNLLLRGGFISGPTKTCHTVGNSKGRQANMHVK